jgi:predicted MPP superfamily phosphohydrolase
LTAPNLVLTVAWIGAVLGLALLAALILLARRRRGRWRASLLTLLGVVGTGYLLCVWTFLVEPKTLRVHRLEVASAAWSGPPLRVGMISDTHVGAPHVGLPRLRATLERLNREQPDLVVFLGDYAGGHESAELRSAPDRSLVLRGVAALATAQAPLGEVAVLGNHDWWYDGPAVRAQLRAAGVTVLENSAVRVPRRGGAFWVAGLADMESKEQQPSAAQALAEVPPEEPVLMLTHFPDPFPQVPARVAVTLAGHTHCGQVVIPFLGRIVHASHGAKRWPCGLYDQGGRKLFVTSGLGVSILPVRFRAPPEIAILTLRSAA